MSDEVCQASTVKGEPCRAYPRRGFDYCAAHLPPATVEDRIADIAIDALVLIFRRSFVTRTTEDTKTAFDALLAIEEIKPGRCFETGSKA